MNCYQAYCQNCKRNVFVDKSKISNDKLSFRVRCTNCSNIFTYNIEDSDSFVDGMGRKDYYIEKGKSQINHIKKSDDLKSFLKFVAGIAATLAFAFIVYFALYVLGFENKAGGFAAISGLLFYVSLKNMN